MIPNSDWSQPSGTFVYSPDLAVYVATENHGIIDISGDITTLTVSRRTNEVSNATIELNNKYRKYDTLFMRMDRVVIFMKRVSWVQVFSGYLTKVPYLTVVPGSVTLEAECTIRRLSYTFWDANAPENIAAFYPEVNGMATTSVDSGTSATLYKLLTAVAGWDGSKIWIQEIPGDFLRKVAEVAQVSMDEWNASENPVILSILQEYIGSGILGGSTFGGGGAPSLQTPLTGSNPIKVLPFPKQYTFGDSWGAPRGNGRTHEGTDIMMPQGTPLYACVSGRAVQDKNDLGGNVVKIYANGDMFYYAHLSAYAFNSIEKNVIQGEIVGYVGSTGNSSGPHLHFGYYPNNGSAVNPYSYLKAAQTNYTETPISRQARDPDTGELIIKPGDTGSGFAGGTVLNTPFNFAWSIQDQDLESGAYTGDRAWMNDSSLQESIKNIAMASLRSYQSAPNGDFLAWFPDKFGIYGKTPVLQIRDIEIKDFKVSISDSGLRTHVAVAGTRTPTDPTVGLVQWLETIGVVSVQKEDIMKILLGLDAAKSYKDLDGEWILQRFGIRPYRQASNEIHDPVWEFFLAYQLFQESWTSQFSASVSFTFMPELYPGMRIELPDRNLAFYVESVDHNLSRSTGFTTNARISCPTTRGEDGKWNLLPLERVPTEVADPNEAVRNANTPSELRYISDLEG